MTNAIPVRPPQTHARWKPGDSGSGCPVGEPSVPLPNIEHLQKANPATCWLLAGSWVLKQIPISAHEKNIKGLCLCVQVTCPNFQSCNVPSKSASRTSNPQLANPTQNPRGAHLGSPPAVAACRGGARAAALRPAPSIPQHPAGDDFWEREFCLGFSLSFRLIWVWCHSQ